MSALDRQANYSRGKDQKKSTKTIAQTIPQPQTSKLGRDVEQGLILLAWSIWRRSKTA